MLRQQGLLVGDLGADMRGDGIGQLAGLLDIAQTFARVLRQLLVQLGIFVELIDHAAHHAGDLGAFRLRRRDGLNGRRGQRALFGQAHQPRTRLPLHQHPHRAIGQLQQLQHAGHHANVIQIIRHRIVAAGVQLRDKEDILVAVPLLTRCPLAAGIHSRLQRRHRFLAAHEQRHHHAGKHNDIAQRQQRKSFLGHNHPSLHAMQKQGRAHLL